MAITPHPKASYPFCLRRVIKYSGWGDPNSVEGDLVAPNAPVTLDHIRKQICQSDVEVCALMASVEDDPYRNHFFTETPDAVSSGGRIPAYIGVHGGVEVNLASVWHKAELAQSLEHLQRVRDKYAVSASMVPASSHKLYWIDNGKLELAVAATGRVYVPTIPIPTDSDSVPVLSTPKARQWALIAHSLMVLRLVGTDKSHRDDWETIWAGYEQRIMKGKASLPEPERLSRVAL